MDDVQVCGQALGDAWQRCGAGSHFLHGGLVRGHHRPGQAPRPVPLLLGLSPTASQLQPLLGMLT